MHGVHWQIVPVALPETVNTFQCCKAEAQEIYERFLQSEDVCTHSILLLPVRHLLGENMLLSWLLRVYLSLALQVKLCSDTWPLEPNITHHGRPTGELYGERNKLC